MARPRLPRFNRAHPGIDVRVVASNDRPDLERDQLDIAIRFVNAGGDLPDRERLLECRSFPVWLARPGSQGSGVAIGVLPHVIPYLRDGMLCAPFGREAVAHRGTFFVVRRPDVAERKPVQAFVAWLWHEVEQEGEFTLASARSKQRAHRAVAKAQSGGSIRR